VSEAERRTGLWRVAHRSDPLGFTPRERCSWGHRFDDTRQRHRTLYCAEAPQTALREVLADLRPNAAVIAKHLEKYGAAAAESLPRTPITERWRQENVLVPCALAYDGRLLDLADPAERRAVETRHAQLLADHGMSHLDMHEITTRRRIVTQTIATDASPDTLGVAAIRFVSSRDGQACIALFEGRAELEPDGTPLDLTDPAPAPLLEVAAGWGLHLTPAVPSRG
jgi:RES domain